MEHPVNVGTAGHPLIIDDSISPDAVDTLLKLIHHDIRSIALIPESHYLELRRLANEFQMPDLKAVLDDFLNDPAHSTRPQNLFIAEILDALQHHLLTNELEKQLSVRLLDHIGDARFAAIPLPVLWRAVQGRLANGERRIPAELFNFFIRCLGIYGGAASILFLAVPLTDLTWGQIQALRGTPAFEWQLVKGQIAAVYLKYTSKVSRLSMEISRFSAYIRNVSDFTGVPILNGRPSLQLPPIQRRSGVIAWLTKRYGGNVDDRKVVIVSAVNRLANPNFAPKVVADLASDQRYTSDETAQRPWVAYDFKDHLVIPTHYEIRSAVGPSPGTWHPRSWVLEASADGKRWDQLDLRQNVGSLDGDGVVALFPLQPRQTQYRCLRLAMTQKNPRDNWSFTITAWEIYGTLLGPSEPPGDFPRPALR
jgi:hypothetical protein